MGTIKELPTLDRPREKAIRYGIETLSDIELLTLLISNGYKGYSAFDVAVNCIKEFNGLLGLSRATVQDIKKIKGLKDAKALNLATIFELHKRISVKQKEEDEVVIDSHYLYNKYKDKMLSNHQENLAIVILGSRRNILREKTLYVGTENNVIFSYKDIWREMLINNGKYFYLIHSHPGKSSKPSKADIIFTSELMLACKRNDAVMIDHLIIGEDGYYSFQNMKK